MVYMLKMSPRLWWERRMVPESCSSSFRERPTCSAWSTSQKTQISARSLWMLALHVGSRALRTDRLTVCHTCQWRGAGEWSSYYVIDIQGPYRWNNPLYCYSTVIFVIILTNERRPRFSSSACCTRVLKRFRHRPFVMPQGLFSFFLNIYNT